MSNRAIGAVRDADGPAAALGEASGSFRLVITEPFSLSTTNGPLTGISRAKLADPVERSPRSGLLTFQSTTPVTQHVEGQLTDRASGRTVKFRTGHRALNFCFSRSTFALGVVPP